MNFPRLAADWLRFLRGKRSQRAFSKRLGYRSNIAYRWESEVCFPTAAEVLKIIERAGVSLAQRVDGFFGTALPAALPAQLASPAGVAALLRALRGNTHVVELSRRSGFSRFSIARWLSGASEPRLPEFLALIEAASFRCLDFLSHFVALEHLPSAAAEWQTLQAARKAAYDVPWSHAVLRALELTDYAKLENPRPGWLARRLGISRAEEERCLKTLAAAHQIRKEGARWLVDHTQTIDTRADPERGRKLKAEWLKVALARLQGGVPGTFSYNLMAVSRKDLARLRELHIGYFREMQALVADSEPSECVVLFNTELFALDAHVH
jgi:DNA-binding phage protein